jgi:hypothetical protein
MADANYSFETHASTVSTSGMYGSYLNATPTTSAVRFGYQNSATDASDFTYVTVNVFR